MPVLLIAFKNIAVVDAVGHGQFRYTERDVVGIVTVQLLANSKLGEINRLDVFRHVHQLVGQIADITIVSAKVETAV